MRILAQTRTVDLPYEKVGVAISGLDDSEIIAYPIRNCDDDFCWILAKYSTNEKAMKAIDLMHRTYTGILLAQNLSYPEDFEQSLEKMVKHGFGIVSIVKSDSEVKFEPLNTVFKFPSEEEIKV